MFDSMQNAEIIGTLTKEFNEVRKKRRSLSLLLILPRNSNNLRIPGDCESKDGAQHDETL